MRTLPDNQIVQSFIQKRFGTPAASFWGRLLHGETDGPLSAPTPMDTPVFQRARLFRVRGPDQLLPLPSMPTGSYGHFGWDGEIHALTGQPDAFGALLMAERRALDAMDPMALAQLVLDVLGQDAYDGHAVVRSFADVETFEYHGERYRVAEEAREVAHRIQPPQIEVAPDGWRLQAHSLCGWMHEKQALGEERWWFGRDGSVRRDPRVVFCPRVFSEMPPISY